MSGGTKHDTGKYPMDLISTRFLNGLASVLGFGAKKYASHNWRKGIQFSRLYAAMLRHMTAWNDGEDIDGESGLPHLYHAACCLMFLSELSETRKDLDDRYATTKHLGPKITEEQAIKVMKAVKQHARRQRRKGDGKAVYNGSVIQVV